DASYDEHHYRAFTEFAAQMLTPRQTFLDLTNSPMLYALAHRRSPHYLNHLYLAHDEHLQLSELAEIQRNDVPLVLAWMEDDEAGRDGVIANNYTFGDSVHDSVRHWLIREGLQASYEPWCIVQRWQVWRRKNWLAPAAPEGSDQRELATFSGPLPADGRI